jgi:colanic acid biosynthesis glycosyl transferase WcaI
MTRLIFVNRFFFPDHSATSQILSDLAFYLAGQGNEVHVITSRQIYDDSHAALADRETLNSVHVHRVASTQFGRSGLPGRALDYLSFQRSVRRSLVEIARPNDLIIAKTDPPLLFIAAHGAARRRGARLVNWLQDIYPETAVVLDVPLIRGPVGEALVTLRNRCLRQAEMTVVVGELMAQRVQTLGAPATRIHIIPNWCNDEVIKPIAQQNNPLRERWGLLGKFVFGYSGNLGRAHDYSTVLEAAERLRNDARIIFLMIGGGNHLYQLRSAVKARGLDNSFRFMPYQEQAMLPFSLAVPDAHWLSLNPKLEGMIVPSKFYGIAAAGKPIVVVGDPAGELARLVRHHDCGAAVAPGDANVLAGILEHWARQPQTISACGARAREMLDKYFTRRQSLARWSELIKRLG